MTRADGSTSAMLAVVGAINVDLVAHVARLPTAGETVGGGTFSRHHGGKGGNQAVAAARALGGTGGRVAMVGAVGDDDLGAAATQALSAEGIEVLVASPPEPTGVAVIVVDAAGENQIAVAPGANASLGGAEVTRALRGLAPAAVLASLEVPREAVAAAAAYCNETGAVFVCNPAPIQTWTAEVIAGAAYLTPNEMELLALDPVPAGAVVVETRGAQGVRIHRGAEIEDLSAPQVEVVDTTGAGDCFNGVFAAGLVEGRDLREAVARALWAAARSVTFAGAREGMPVRAEIDAMN